VGGPSQGRHWLWDSDQDWGQGLPQLAAWLKAHGTSRVILAYSGPGDPRAYGIEYQDLLSPALITHLYRGEIFADWTGPRYVAIGTKVLQSEPRWLAAWEGKTPTATIAGGTFEIYDITREPESWIWLARFYTVTHRPELAAAMTRLIKE